MCGPSAVLRAGSILKGLGPGVLSFGRLVGLLLAGLFSCLVIGRNVRWPRGG